MRIHGLFDGNRSSHIELFLIIATYSLGNQDSIQSKRLHFLSKLSFFLYEIFGKISRFSISLSIDTLPGPDNNRLIEININNKSTSKPPCPIKPLPAFTIRTAQIISIVKRIEVILVSNPTINNTPPITSSSPISRAKSAGIPTEAKKPCVPCKFSNFGKPWIIKAIPAIILIGKGANAEIFSKYITKKGKSSFL